MSLTPEQIAQVDPAYWAAYNMIKLQNCRFSFKDHDYQKEPMASQVRRICYMKATQGGFSEIEVLKSLHGMINKKYSTGVLYMFPTADDVGEFSKSRFNPLILANKKAIGKFVKKTDTVSLKKIHDAFLFLRGAKLSQKIGEQNESSKLRSISVDRVVFDEVDHIWQEDGESIEKAKGRYGHSKIKEECYISNPTTPGVGIDLIWARSDQRYWYRRCKCGEWTCAELSFPECVHLRPDGTGYIACTKCGLELGINGNAGVIGHWVPQKKENSDYMHGYHHSQLTSVYNDPAEILNDFHNPPNNNLGDIYRLRLGLPYIAAEDRLIKSQVYAGCNNDIMPDSHPGPCAMGIDVGKTNHIVIGIRTSQNQYKVVKLARMSDWNSIHDLAKRFNVKSAVIDIRPYENTVRNFQKEEPYNIYLCEYNENTAVGRQYNPNTGIVKVNRTEIFDETHRMVVKEGMLSIPRDCTEVREFARQMCGAYKILETNKKTKRSVYRYKGDDEHYRNAMNYFTLACSGNKIAIARGKHDQDRQTVADNNWRVA